MQGWVSLHRRINNSETFEKLNILQKLMAIYIILNASHTDRIWYDKYKDIEVHLKRGELITSRNTIKNDWFHGDKEVTDAKIRTTFKKLERFGFLTIETTSNYTKLKVCNYNLYQGEEGRSNQVNDQEETKYKPSGNQEKTTINKVKNVNNDKNVNNKEIVPSQKVKATFDETHYQLAEFLYTEMLKNTPNLKKPNLEKWSDDIRKLMTINKRTYKEINYIILWSQSHSFWKPNIRSASTLRDKFDTLYLQAEEEHKKRTGQLGTGKQKLTQDDWANM